MSKTRTKTTLPARFEPMFWGDADGRSLVVKEVKRRYETLITHTGADSYQKEILVQRAVFMTLQLESMEIRATQTGELDVGVHTQMTNALLGLLKTLGLDRKLKDAGTLRAYVEGNDE